MKARTDTTQSHPMFSGNPQIRADMAWSRPVTELVWADEISAEAELRSKPDAYYGAKLAAGLIA